VPRKHRRRSVAHHRTKRAHIANDRPLRAVPAEEPIYSKGPDGLATSLAPGECTDDRPQLDSGADNARATATVAPSASPLTNPGVLLRHAREGRGLSIDDLSRTTKIRTTTLAALEAGDLPHLPAAIYTRGFVKAYAREVGLDAESAADEYLAQIEPLRAHHPPPGGGEGPLPDVAHSVDAAGDSHHVPAAGPVRRFAPLITAAAVVGLIIYIASFNREAAREADRPAAASKAPVSDAGPAGGTTDARRDPDALTAADRDGLRVVLATERECWLSAQVDGERVVARLLQAGERQTLDVSDEAVLRVGDAGAISISINGRAGRPLGRSGQPLTIRVTKDNYEEFLAG
jgi:hypothetical protein